MVILVIVLLFVWYKCFNPLFLKSPERLALFQIRIHLAYIANDKSRVIWNNKVTVLKARWKYALINVNRHNKMMSVMTLEDVTSFLHMKDVTNSCKRMRNSPTIGRISSVKWWKMEEAADFKFESHRGVCSPLLSKNNALFP